MRKKYKFLGQSAVFFLCVVLYCSMVFAAGGTKVMEKYSGESEIALYVKGSEDVFENITVQVGTAVCSSVEKNTLSETKQSIRTLVVLDNSESIPKKDRKKISKILRNVISDKAENEQIAIAVLNKDMEYLADYTSDNAVLKSAVSQITYRNTKTYLTDVLYEWFSKEYIPRQAESYYRILVIADGTDNKPIGYTQDEFYSMLKDYPVPIYAIGVKTKNNNENLENMFAISRASNADSFLLDDIENVQDISNALHEGRTIVKLVIRPQAELLDGNRKTVKILFESGDTLSTEMVMPQVKYEQKETVIQDDENEERTDVKDEESNVWDEKGGKDNVSKKKILILTATVGAAVLLLLAVIFLFARKKKAHSQTGQESASDNPVNQIQEQQSTFREDKTEVGVSPFPQNSDQTVVVWNPGVAYQLILQDVNVTAKSIEFPLKRSAIIGRKPDMSDIAFENDKTVSGRHCEVAVRDGRFYITDLKSSNGTYINGRKVVSEMEIFPGDLLRLGKLELKFHIK